MKTSRHVSRCGCLLLLCLVWSANAGAASPKPEMVMQHSHSLVTNVAFDAHSRILAALGSGHGQALIDIWDTRTWTLLRTIDLSMPNGEAYGNFVESFDIALSPDGRTIAVGAKWYGVGLWDVRSGKLLRRLHGPASFGPHVVWSADGRMLAAGGRYDIDKPRVRVWSAKTGKVLRTLNCTGCPTFSHDGKILGVAGYDQAYLFDLASGRRIRTFQDKSGARSPMAISPNGKLVVTGGEDPKFVPIEECFPEINNHDLVDKVWDARTGKLLAVLPGHPDSEGGTSSLQFTPDGRKLLSSGECRAYLWDVKSFHCLREFDCLNSCISPDVRMIAIAEPGLKVVSASTGKVLFKAPNPPAPVESLAFSPDGKLLAAGSGDILRLWDTRNRRLAHTLPGYTPDDVCGLAFISEQEMLCNNPDGAHVWNPTTGALVRTREGDAVQETWGTEYRRALLTPDGSKLIYIEDAGPRKAYTISDASTGEPLAAIEFEQGGSGSTCEAVFSPDGHYLIAPVESEGYTIWNLDTGKQVSKLEHTNTDGLRAFTEQPMAFSPDGKTIAASVDVTKARIGKDGVIVNYESVTYAIALWDRGTGKMKSMLSLGKHPIAALAFSRDGGRLAAAIAGTIHVYDAGALREIGAGLPNGVPVNAVAFSPDGRLIAWGDEEGRVCLWEVDARKLLITMVGLSADGQKRTSDWYSYAPDGGYDWSEGAASLIRWRVNGKLFPAGAFGRRSLHQSLQKDSK